MAIEFPAEIGDAVLRILQRLNNDVNGSIQIVMVAAKTGEKPTVVSSIHPDQLGDIFAWLAHYHGESTFTQHHFDGKLDS